MRIGVGRVKIQGDVRLRDRCVGVAFAEQRPG